MLLKYLRTIAITLLVIGAIGSLGFMFYTGRNNDSVVLMTLFTGWVLLPYIGIGVAAAKSKRWSVPENVIYSLMIIISVVSLVCYSGVISPAGTKPAFMFLVVPGVSWMLMAIVFPLARRRSRGPLRL